MGTTAERDPDKAVVLAAVLVWLAAGPLAWRRARARLGALAAEAQQPGRTSIRPTLEALMQYMVEQHFIEKAIPIDDLFVPVSE